MSKNIKSIGQNIFYNNRDIKDSNQVTITKEVLNLICDWKSTDGSPFWGDGKTVKENFKIIFGVDYTS